MQPKRCVKEFQRKTHGYWHMFLISLRPRKCVAKLLEGVLIVIRPKKYVKNLLKKIHMY